MTFLCSLPDSRPEVNDRRKHHKVLADGGDIAYTVRTGGAFYGR